MKAQVEKKDLTKQILEIKAKMEKGTYKRKLEETKNEVIEEKKLKLQLKRKLKQSNKVAKEILLEGQRKVESINEVHDAKLEEMSEEYNYFIDNERKQKLEAERKLKDTNVTHEVQLKNEKQQSKKVERQNLVISTKKHASQKEDEKVKTDHSKSFAKNSKFVFSIAPWSNKKVSAFVSLANDCAGNMLSFLYVDRQDKKLKQLSIGKSKILQLFLIDKRMQSCLTKCVETYSIPRLKLMILAIQAFYNVKLSNVSRCLQTCSVVGNNCHMNANVYPDFSETIDNSYYKDPEMNHPDVVCFVRVLTAQVTDAADFSRMNTLFDN